MSRRPCVRAAVLVSAVVSLSGCQWIAREGDPWTFNPGHGDRVDVEMLPTPGAADRCLDMGGRPGSVLDPVTLVVSVLCEAVDF